MSGAIFQPFPKLYRLRGPVIVTEKIDGTNACIIVDDEMNVFAQSRTQLITPQKDNHGFARWVYENAAKLAHVLGTGYHYGEWWGKGIQRGYGLEMKVFSLFNTTRWYYSEFYAFVKDIGLGAQVDVVPVLYTGTFTQVMENVPEIMLKLKLSGSKAAPEFMNPEGIVIYDTQSGTGFKKTFDYDDSGKGGQKDEHGNVL